MESTGEGHYENPWTYQGATFTSDDIDDFFGFVYRITNLQTGKQYIGRKYFTRDGLRLRVTGKNTTEVLQNLRPILRTLEKDYSEEK